jgi:(5-formylfuran-3-yl)methyl phosphate synthase
MSKIKLLISVKNTQEAMLATEAGADFIDLKDPEVGALGSLNDEDTMAILQALQGRVAVSATIGDSHDSWQSQLALIQHKVALGLTIIKLPITPAIENEGFRSGLQQCLAECPIKLIGVFFADEEFDVMWIPKLAGLGFYGVMLDTQHKSNSLLSAMSTQDVAEFVKLCKLNQLIIGLAGALRVECLDNLLMHQPSYLGFRSGVCKDYCRKNNLLPNKVTEISKKLQKHNNLSVKM